MPVSIKATVQKDYSVKVGDTLTINGVLKSGSVPWANEQVVLMREGYANLTDITDANGNYKFSFSYTLSDIGRHNYTVYFPGNPSLLRQEGVLQEGVISVTETITMKAFTDQGTSAQTVTPNFPYNVIVTFEFSDGTPFDPTTASFENESNIAYDFSILKIDVIETYQDTGGGTPDTTTALNLVDQPVTGSTLTYSSNTGNQISSMDIKLSVTLKNYLEFADILSFKSESDNTQPVVANKLILQIDINYVFTAQFLIDGANLIDGSRQYRQGQNVTVAGTLSNAVLGIEYVRGVGYTYTLTYGTQTLVTKTGKTDTNGKLKETFYLNKTVFNDTLQSVTIRVDIDTSNSTITNLSPSSVSRSFSLYEYIGSITIGPLQDTTTVFSEQGSQFLVNGTVYDIDGNASASAKVKFSILDSTNALIPNFAPTATTNGTGFFEKTITLPSMSTGNGTFFLKVEVVNGTFPNDVWYIQNAVEKSYGKFNYTQGATMTIQNLRGKTLIDGNISRVFNDSFAKLLQQNPSYTINVIDIFGRAPYGMTVQLIENYLAVSASSSSLVYTINSSNNGVFVVKINDFSKLLDPNGPNGNRLTNHPDTFRYDIILKSSKGSTVQTLSESYQLYGPDESPPTLNPNSLTVTGNDGTSGSDIVVSIALQDPTQVHNIRNVTIFYRLSLNKNVNDTTPDFGSQPFIARAMTNDTANNRFTFTFLYNSSQNGIWIEFYFIAYDLAGNGLDVNGVTIRPPAYDPNYTLSYDIRTNPSWTDQIVRMGDLSISDINLGTGIEVNGTQLGAFDGAIANGSQLIIIFNAPDPDIEKVFLIYRTRSVDPITLEAGDWSDNITVEMLKMTGNRWNYTFSGDLLVWGIELDYRFAYRDIYGNAKETSFVSTEFSGSTTRRNPIVVDSDAPTATAVVHKSPYNETYPIAGRNGNNGTFYEIWNNETLTIAFNLTDGSSGSGVANVTFFITYYFANGSVYKVINQTVFTSKIFGEGQDVQITFDIPTDFYVINGSFTWYANATDKFGNVLLINQNGINYIIREPPKPPLPPDQTILTSNIVTTINGSEVTLTTSVTVPLTNATQAESGSDYRGLIIFTGFIFGLFALVLYYKRHTLIEYIKRRNRARLLQSRLQDISDDIARLAKDGNYKEAVLLIWQAFERACREALQAPRKYNMTVRMYTDYIGTITLVDPLVLTTLAHVFEKARYGNEEITEDDFKEAFNALEVTIQTLIATGAKRIVLEDEDEDFDIDIDIEEE